MADFKVGDRVAGYSGCDRYVGMVYKTYKYSRTTTLEIELGNGDIFGKSITKILNTKQCRKLVKKKKEKPMKDKPFNPLLSVQINSKAGLAFLSGKYGNLTISQVGLVNTVQIIALGLIVH